MTVVLAYRDPALKCAYMASDSCASDVINHSLVRNNKVFHPVGRKDILIGCAGTFRLPNLLQFVPDIFPGEDILGTDEIDMSYLVNEFTPVVGALVDGFDESDAWEMLLAVGDRIYRMQMDLSIVEPADESDAIGSGGSVALGAFKVLNELEPNMPIEDRMKHALNVACSSCQGCMPPFAFCKTEEPDVKPDGTKVRVKTGYEIIRHDDECGFVDEIPTAKAIHKKKKKKKKCKNE